ncbi:hypothetical protein AV530_018746 [Patagioenas fasciata monilis]|uniref:Uncharacterized protein n=1 Tax=Patagioenas fasciata monilis TaxID=372326 RepID=A0A1V4JJD1_PATFA|nr:hypothetical protein AV530_018746 [Patagioenas fasciata monilis]
MHLHRHPFHHFLPRATQQTTDPVTSSEVKRVCLEHIPGQTALQELKTGQILPKPLSHLTNIFHIFQ